MTHGTKDRTVRNLSFAVAVWALLGAVACGDDEKGDEGSGGSGATTGGTGAGAAGGTAGVGATSGSGGGGAASGGTGGASLDAFNGDCTTARWGDVSEACWSCMCEACAESLNACDETCMDALKCGFDAQCMVNVGSEILCEVRCVGNVCLTDAASQAAAPAVVTFDNCLMAAEKPSGFRICEDVCGIPYTGDVCTRYP